MKTVKVLFLKHKYIVFILAASFLSVLDLANYGIPPTHDGEYHVLRFQQFYKVLETGNFYPRWAPDFNNGFGIPLFNFVYPLPNYVASLFHFFGFSFIDSLKLNMAVATFVGAIFMYLWSKKYWGELGATVSSVFYTFSPYHFLDIYVRGSVGEVWSLGLIPALLWSYDCFCEKESGVYLALTAVFIGLLIYAHNILAMVFFGFFLLYTFYLILNTKRRRPLFINTLLIIFVGLGLAAPFWLPALSETKYVVGLETSQPLQNFPVLYKLIYSSWGYGFSGTNSPDQMSFQIGIADLSVVIIIIYLLFKRKLGEHRDIISSLLLVLIASVFLMTPLSTLIWKTLPLISYMQFPWRLLSLVILIISFLSGSIVRSNFFKTKKMKQLIASALILISIGFSIRYAKAPFYHKRDDSHYLARANFTDGTNSPGDAFNTFWLNKVPQKQKNRFAASGSANIIPKQINSDSYRFYASAQDATKVTINTAYFPGWAATINGKPSIVENYKGRMRISVKKGLSDVYIQFSDTLIRKVAFFYFLISILLIIVVGARYAYSNRYKSSR